MRKLLVRMGAAIMTALIDLRTQFAAATSIAHAQGEVILGDVIPLDTSGMNLGQAMTPVYLVISVDTTMDSAGGAATVLFKLMSHSTSTITSGTAHFTSAAFTEAQAIAGAVLCCIPLPLAEYGSYLGVSYTIGGETSTAGKVNAYLTLDPPNGWKAYANAI